MTSRSTSRPKQLIIGLDAGEWSLIRRWSAAGKLPAFRALLERGAYGELTTTAAQLPDTVWSCIYSGRNPATFDKYFYVQYDPRTQNLRHVKDDAFTKEPFWKVLSDAGHTVGVVDAVKFGCSDTLHGFQLANWGCHATKATKESLPRDLLADVERRFGRHPVGDCDKVDDEPESRRDLLERILAGTRMRGDVNLAMMRERPWDVFFTVFSEPHCIGHHFWHGADGTHPRHAEIGQQGLADAIEKVYVAIDREVGRMVEHAGDDALCLVVSGHGMGPIYHASWNLGEMLDLLGYGPNPARKAGARKARKNPWRRLKMLLPGKLQYAIKNALPESLQDELLFRWYAGKRDWKGWRAFAVPNNDSVGAIRVAVRGRDRHGIVAPAEYDAVCEDIATALEELVDPVSGRKVVRRVTRIHREFAGPYLAQLPDLTVLWDQSFPWHAVESPRLGRLELGTQDSRTGSHTPVGFFVAAGPMIAKGGEIARRSIYDIAPTIYAVAGVKPPAGLDGQALPILAAPVRA